MVHEQLFFTLMLTAATVGSLHSLAPDHWFPFAALARAQNWSLPRTARITVLCGLGHVTASVLLGLLGVAFGLGVFAAFGRSLESVAGILLVGFGLAYGAWGLKRAMGARLHGHAHDHYDHVHDTSGTTSLALFLLFSADPCVAVIPLVIAAATLRVWQAVTVVVVYEAVTILTMVLLVLPARAGATVFRTPWIERYGDVAAGVLIAGVGLLTMGLGW